MITKNDLTQPMRNVLNYLRCHCGPGTVAHIGNSIRGYDGNLEGLVKDVIDPLMDFGLVDNISEDKSKPYYVSTKEGNRVLCAN